MNKKNCNKEVNGIIKELKIKGADFPTIIIVEYEVENKKYTIKENLVMKKDKIIKFAFLPIGYKTKSLIEITSGIEAKVGNTVKVMFDSTNPSNAYLIDNVAKTTYL